MAESCHWWQRAVPVTGFAALAVTGALLMLPEDQVEVSTSRSPQPFVELFLTHQPDKSCDADSATLRFRMVSHLQRTSTLRYRVAVDPAGSAKATVRERGKVRLDPGRTKTVRVDLPATPSGAHDITLRLQQRPEQLRIHCEEATS
jgi:hypothetical protein